MEKYFIDDVNTPEHLKISDDNKISLYSYINIYQKDDIYKKKIRKTIMENLKIKHYLKIGETCSICLEEIWRRKDAFLTDCGHSFHLQCIINYDYKYSFEKMGVFCPLCRCDMGNYLDFRDRYKYSRNSLDILDDFENNKDLKLPQICYNYNERFYNKHFYGNRFKDCSYCRLKR
jgi:hypothetical protein